MKILIATEKPFAAIAVKGITDIFQKAGHEVVLLEKYSSVDDLLKAVVDVDAMIVRSDKVTADVVAQAKNLKIVVRAGAGFDNLDLSACKAKSIVCMNTPGQNSNAVAELAIGFMLFMSRNQFSAGSGIELKGKTLGIHAYGNVGKLVAKIAKGFGMKVLAFDPFVSKEVIEKDDVEVAEKIEDLYSKSNFISLHIPANEKTKKSINYDLLKNLPKGACVINTARKEVIDEDGLCTLLLERSDLKYATDIVADNQAKLNEMFGNRVFATPKKMGAETAEANINAGLAAANQIVNFFAAGDTTFALNL
jgi:D-3-phosphoglycerate dehydrogenase